MARYREPVDQDMPDGIDLPDDMAQGKPDSDLTLLSTLGISIAKKRDEAMTARKSSGIEEIWMNCEEAYLGIDDANRTEFSNAKWAKPTTMDAQVTTSNGAAKAAGVRSTVFVRLTSRYVDAGSAKLAEILLPMDDKNFTLKPLPVPDLILQKDDLRQAMDGMTGAPLMRDMTQEEIAAQPAAAPPGFPGATSSQVTPPAQPAGAPGAPGAPLAQPGQVPLTVADIANQKLDAAADAAEKAETRIYSWMVDCRRPSEVRKVIFDAGRIGVGVLKSPTPAITKSMALTKDDKGDPVLQIKKKVVPVSRWIDPWNLFPDPACGEDIHNGDFIIERDFLAPKKLKDIGQLYGYLQDQYGRP